MTTPIDGTSFNTGSTEQTKAVKPGGEMDKDAFMKLLLAQMQYQDPLDPQDNSEFVAQLAQFSSLEQMENFNTSMVYLNRTVETMNSSLLIGQLNGFIGQDIKWKTKDEDGVEKTHTGKVTAVKMVDGKATLIVKDATNNDKVTSIEPYQITGLGNLDDLKTNDKDK